MNMNSFGDRRYSTKSSSSFNATTGIMHHQIKLDVFLIKGYQLVSHNAVINAGSMCKMITSPGSNIVSDAFSDKELAYFQKLSQLYDATLPLLVLDDSSTSPKSAIELFQRFQQILKELELSFEVSPYAKYFDRLGTKDNSGLWQIKSDDALQDDLLWKFVSDNVKKIYDVERGLILSVASKKRSAVNSTKNSPPQTKEDPISYQQLRRKLARLQANSETSGVMGSKSVTSNMATSAGNTKDWMKSAELGRSKAIDSDGLLRGYYTMPTSPTSLWNNGISLGLADRRDFQNTPDPYPVEELLQLATNSITEGTDENGTEAPVVQDKKPNASLLSSENGKKLKKSSSATGILSSSDLPIIDEVTNIPVGVTPKEAELYDRLLKEKDDRIIELERQLKSERCESQWLRKLLLEDVGSIRSMLRELKDK